VAGCIHHEREWVDCDAKQGQGRQQGKQQQHC
jgi:hypothetical protein